MDSSRMTKLKLITSIRDTDCTKLDISNRYGSTSYIDFIEKSELQENVMMRGIDDFNRPFIVFKAQVIYNDSEFNKKIINTFTTFFQRYTDDSLLWHACGHDGPLLFDTAGGANITQLKLLDDLLKNGVVDLTPDMDYDKLKLYYIRCKDIKRIRIQLGHSI
jgi:hypothetical protein